MSNAVNSKAAVSSGTGGKGAAKPPKPSAPPMNPGMEGGFSNSPSQSPDYPLTPSAPPMEPGMEFSGSPSQLPDYPLTPSAPPMDPSPYNLPSQSPEYQPSGPVRNVEPMDYSNLPPDRRPSAPPMERGFSNLPPQSPEYRPAPPMNASPHNLPSESPEYRAPGPVQNVGPMDYSNLPPDRRPSAPPMGPNPARANPPSLAPRPTARNTSSRPSYERSSASNQTAPRPATATPRPSAPRPAWIAQSGYSYRCKLVTTAAAPRLLDYLQKEDLVRSFRKTLNGYDIKYKGGRQVEVDFEKQAIHVKDCSPETFKQVAKLLKAVGAEEFDLKGIPEKHHLHAVKAALEVGLTPVGLEKHVLQSLCQEARHEQASNVPAL
jgi:hypothetical protein